MTVSMSVTGKKPAPERLLKICSGQHARRQLRNGLRLVTGGFVWGDEVKHERMETKI